MSSPSSESKNKPRKKPELYLPPAFTLSYLAYSSTLKMEATYSSVMLVDFQQMLPMWGLGWNSIPT
jgi:hypothetical protein